jgi:hypothetical protein
MQKRHLDFLSPDRFYECHKVDNIDNIQISNLGRFYKTLFRSSLTSRTNKLDRWSLASLFGLVKP